MRWRRTAPERIAMAGEGTPAPVMMPQFRFVYDGIAAMLAVLSMMHERKAKLSEISASYPRYCILKGQVPLHPRQIPGIIRGAGASL
jgi:phosphomannomutase